MAVKKGLGRGLGSLLGDTAVEEVDADVKADAAAKHSETIDAAAVKLRLVDVYPNPEQPRKAFDEERIRALADSIAKHGVLQPVAVRRHGDGYVLIAGERRWRAARIAGLKEIPAVIVDADDRVAAELALIENLQRQDLNPVEEAEGYKMLSELYGMTDTEIGEIVGKDRSTISNMVRLLALERPVLDMLADGELTAGHARALLPLNAVVQTTLAEITVKEGYSVRKVEELVKGILTGRDEPDDDTPSRHVKVDYYDEVAKALSSKLGRKVKIDAKPSGRGWIRLEYYSDDDLTVLSDALKE